MFVVMGWQQWAASTCQQIKTRDERAAAHLARRQVIRLFLTIRAAYANRATPATVVLEQKAFVFVE
jgi:hypothetical protein